ncbi:MAG: hypothetical protein QG663_1607 [Thermodesulfobacteriota bacterium]|nr:hypothetical protein [Thermodesulfobacteriota bacterium]
MEARTFEMEFAKFIQKFHQEIRDVFIEDTFLKREILAHYQLAREMLEELADSVLSEFTVNIDKKTSVETIADRYVQLGIRCCDDGLSYSEMVRVFILLKRHIWLFFQESNFAGQPFDVRSIVALNNRTTLFFDRAMYYFLVGFEQTESENKTEFENMYNSFLDRVCKDVKSKMTSTS